MKESPTEEPGTSKGSLCIGCCILSIVFFIMPITAFYTIVYAITFSAYSPPVYDSTLYVHLDEFVKIEYKHSENYDTLIGRSLSVSTNSSSIGLDSISLFVDVYQTNCKDLDSHSIEERNIIVSSAILSDGCEWRCGIEDFIYFVGDERSLLTYNLTIPAINLTQVFEGRVVIFDNYPTYAAFLEGRNEEKGIVQQVTFKLTASNRSSSAKFRFLQSSYYFSAFENLSGTSDKLIFGVTQGGVQVFYNGKALTYTCTAHFLSACNDMRLSENYKQCFFLYAYRVSVENQTNIVPVYIHYDYSSIITGIVIASGGLLTAFSSLCFWCCLCGWLYRFRQCYAKQLRKAWRHSKSNDKPNTTKELQPLLIFDTDDSNETVSSDENLNSSSSLKFLPDSNSPLQTSVEIFQEPVEIKDQSSAQLLTSGMLREQPAAPSVGYIGKRDLHGQQISLSLRDLLIDVFHATPDQISAFQDSLCGGTVQWASTSQRSATSGNFQIISFDENGLFHYSYEYGVALIIPQGAVEGHATVQFGVSLLSTNFKCKGNFDPVSPFVWIHTEADLSKPVKLYVPHYAMAKDTEDMMKLYLLTKGHGETDVYKVNDRIRASIGERLVQLSATHFCSVCLASTPVPKKRYHLVCTIKEDVDGTYLKVCVLYSFKCLKQFRDNHEGYKLVSDICPPAFEALRIDVHVPENSGWDFSFQGFKLHRIKEEQVDIYKVLGCTASTVTEEDIEDLKAYEGEGLYPPCFKLSFTPKPCMNKSCQAKVTLISDTVDWKSTISVDLPGETVFGSPTSASLDSGFANGGYLLNAEGTNDVETDDAEFINMMTFLESKVDTNYIAFGHHLGMEMSRLYQLDETLGHDKKRCIRQILFQWRARSPTTDKLHEVIAEALESTGYHLLSDMVKHYLGSAVFCTLCQRPHGGNAEALNSIDSIGNFLQSGHCNAFITAQEPHIADLNNLIAAKIPAKWELFGAQLHIEVPTMNAIKRNNLGECSLCFMQLFNEWKTTQSRPYTWTTVIEALYSCSVHEYTLAEDIYSKKI